MDYAQEVKFFKFLTFLNFFNVFNNFNFLKKFIFLSSILTASHNTCLKGSHYIFIDEDEQTCH